MSDNETVADIVAEMRERADAMQTHGTTHGVRLAVHEFARRIEAAWKREREELERYAASKMLDGVTIVDNRKVGNAAAMRGAMLAIRDINDRRPHDADGYEINDIINAALSAPARNCDRYENAQTARQAWLDDADNWDDFGSPKLELHEWLLAPAEERKGEGDGK